MKTNEVIQGDCIEKLKELPDNSVDAIVTDPPYGINMTYDGFGGSKNAEKTKYVNVEDWDNKTPDREVFKEILRVAKKVFIFGGNYFTDKLPVSKCWLCWDKRCGITPERTYADCELIWSSENSPARIIRFVWDGFIQDSKNKIREKRYHPTQKPIEVIRQIIDRFSDNGFKIFDPFAGSGSHLLASKQKGFDFVGCEINKEYVDIINERLKQRTLLPLAETHEGGDALTSQR